MADTISKNKTGRSFGSRPTKKIVRDVTFVRACADEILPLPLGRDVELSVLQFSPALIGIQEHEDHFEPKLEDSKTEVARIRIGYSEVVEFAMTMLNQGILLNRIKGEKVAETILEWTAEADLKRAESREK